MPEYTEPLLEALKKALQTVAPPEAGDATVQNATFGDVTIALDDKR